MIRKAVESDIPRLAELSKQLYELHIIIRPDFYSPPDESFFKEEIKTVFLLDNLQIFVYCDDEIKAYALVQKIKDNQTADENGKMIFYVADFIVDEKYRGRGIGKELFDYILNYAKEKGCTDIQLSVDADNGNALKFYEKMGLLPRRITLDMKITEEQENEK